MSLHSSAHHATLQRTLSPGTRGHRVSLEQDGEQTLEVRSLVDALMSFRQVPPLAQVDPSDAQLP